MIPLGADQVAPLRADQVAPLGADQVVPLGADQVAPIARRMTPMMKQLILLSTDEEINESLLPQLEPGISDIYSLKHNKSEECTEVMKIN